MTQDVAALGVTDFSNTYEYTVQAASDASGVVKGVSFQCCPAALIYRRSIAKDVLGTDDPAEVQEKLNSWDKFNAVAADAKAKGYLMTASEAATYRVFSNNVSEPWVDANNSLQIPIPPSRPGCSRRRTSPTTATRRTATSGPMSAPRRCSAKARPCATSGRPGTSTSPWATHRTRTRAASATGRSAKARRHTSGAARGCWRLPAWITLPNMVADIMNTFINDEEVCTNLVKNEAQFSNNQKVNETVAQDPTYGSEFLGGQNDIALFCDLAKNIKFENHTIYDQPAQRGSAGELERVLQGHRHRGRGHEQLL